MAVAHTNHTGQAPEADGPRGSSADLPPWLTALDHPAPPASAKANGTAVAARAEAVADPPTTIATAPNESTTSLLDEDDLPAWLKALTAEQPAPPPPVAETAPAWLSQAKTTALAPAPAAPREVAPPPIWNTRPARQEADATALAPIFASLDAATVSGAPTEVEPPPVITVERAGPNWWLVLGVVAALLLVAMAVMLFLVFVR